MRKRYTVVTPILVAWCQGKGRSDFIPLPPSSISKGSLIQKHDDDDDDDDDDDELFLWYGWPTKDV